MKTKSQCVIKITVQPLPGESWEDLKARVGRVMAYSSAIEAIEDGGVIVRSYTVVVENE